MIEYEGKQYELVDKEGFDCKGCCFFGPHGEGGLCQVLEDVSMDCAAFVNNGVFKETEESEQ